MGSRSALPSLRDVDVFVVPKWIVEATCRSLREAGARKREGFVLWGGDFRSESEFEFRSAIRPAQASMSSDDGLLVYVEGEALFEVNRDLYRRGETLAAQVHSHPGEAYHSDTDDLFPMVTLLGGLSIVVPDFARQIDPEQWAIYRLVGEGLWNPIDAATKLLVAE